MARWFARLKRPCFGQLLKNDSAPHGSERKEQGMADLVLVYGMRLLPAEEVKQVGSAPVTPPNGNEAQGALHVLAGTREQIEKQLKQSIDSFFDFYPEI